MVARVLVNVSAEEAKAAGCAFEDTAADGAAEIVVEDLSDVVTQPAVSEGGGEIANRAFAFARLAVGEDFADDSHHVVAIGLIDGWRGFIVRLRRRVER